VAAATGDAKHAIIPVPGVDYDYAEDFAEGAQTGAAVAGRAS